jgi:hypothetical protein
MYLSEITQVKLNRLRDLLCCRGAGSAALALVAMVVSPAFAQGPQSGSETRATQLPLSGRQQTGSAVQQSATPPAGSSVNTLNTQIGVQGAYTGSALDPNAPTGSIVLTMADAVRRGLEFNVGKIGADAASRQAEGQRLSARSSLLPTISAGLTENAAKVNLAAEGFSASAFGNPALNFPTVVGPFHYYDMRGSLQQTLMDFHGAAQLPFGAPIV